jgi:hypothetical protein
MESLNPQLMSSTLAFPKGYFAYTQKGCCGGQAPNFFSSYPNGLQVGPEFLMSTFQACSSSASQFWDR